MTLRSQCQRIIQTLAYEACALALAVPFYALIADRDAGAATVVMLAMMGAERIWGPWFRPVVPDKNAGEVKSPMCYLLSPLARTLAPARVTAPNESIPCVVPIATRAPLWADKPRFCTSPIRPRSCVRPIFIPI